MALSITHSTIATFPDQPDVEINKAEWNDDHAITGTIEQDQNNVAVDGVTITGDGTPGDPLTASIDLSPYVPYTGATGPVDLGANNFTVDTNVFHVDATTNRAGVGTNNPLEKLQVTDGSYIFRAGNTYGLQNVGTAGAQGWANFGTASDAAPPVVWYNAAGISKGRMMAAGLYVGDGVITPSARLQARSTTEQFRAEYDADKRMSLTIGSTGDALFNFIGNANIQTTTFLSKERNSTVPNFVFDTDARVFATGGIKTHYSQGGIVTGAMVWEINPSKFSLQLTPTLGSTTLNTIFTIDGTNRTMALSTGTTSPPTNYTGITVDNRNLGANSKAILQIGSGAYNVYSTIASELLTVSTSALILSTQAGEGARLNGVNSFLIGTNSGNASAKLQVDSTTQGFLPPRMTTTQKNAISSPAAGLVVYDTTLGKLCVYTTAWETITSV